MSGYYSEHSDTDSDNDSNSDSEIETQTKKSVPFKIPGIIKGVTTKDPNEEDDIDDADVSDDSEEDVSEDENEDEEKVGGQNSEQEDVDESDDDEESEDENEVNEDGNIIEKSQLIKTNKTNTKPKRIQPTMSQYDDDDDDDDEYEENYLQKFDNEIIKNYVNDFHPECLNHNYEEIAKMAVVIRNSDGIIIDPLHKTIPYLTKYEKARILGQRSKQIETGAKPLVKVPENIVDGYIIAELELKEKKIPFIIRRPIPGGSCEYWHLRDLENIGF